MLAKLIPGKFLLAAAAVAALYCGGLYVHHTGYVAGYEAGWSAHQEKAQRDLNKTKLANEMAIANARLRFNEAVAQLTLDNRKLTDALDRIDHEASLDPRAASCGIGADSVLRLQSIR